MYALRNLFTTHIWPLNSISRAEVTERRISDTIYANDFYISYISKNWPIFSDYPAFSNCQYSLVGIL